mmetsp:Transcript_62368/g.195509  ORF Transcript_62368/g.195509 Transcript_62368/m.195509 type:complete len:226 (+) Transcript_62368:1142-1819(+)
MIFAVSPAVDGAFVAAAASRALVIPSGSPPPEDAASRTLDIVLGPAGPGGMGAAGFGVGGGAAAGGMRGGCSGAGSVGGACSGGCKGACSGGRKLASREGGRAAAAAVAAAALAVGASRLARPERGNAGAGAGVGGGGSTSGGGGIGSSAPCSSCLAARNSGGIPLMPNTLTVVLWRPSIAPGTFSRSFLCDRLTCDTRPLRLWQSLPKAPTSQNGHAKCFAAWC